jgi:hypothetical protein
MIDPVNPGPAGTTGPAGSQIAASGPGDLTPLLAAGTGVISQAMQSVTGAIQSLFNQAFSTVQGAIAKAAGSIASGYNSAETSLVTAGAQAQAATSSTVQTALGPAGGGGTSDQGVKEGQYAWNVYQYINTPYPARAVNQVGVPGAVMQLWCFRGGWDNGLDAVRYSLGISGSAPPPGCILPGGPSQPSAPPAAGGQCATGLYQVWQQVVGSTITGCQLLCSDSPGPSGGVRVGNPVSLDIATGLMQTLACTGKDQTGTGGSPQYYAGCDAAGNPVSWTTTQGAPSGVTGTAGPFDSMSAALAAVNCVVQPPPPSGGPPSGTGQCCDTAVTKLPDCIYLDLCDWDKFFQNMWQAIKKGMCEFVKDPTCACAIRDSDAAIYEDCDGKLATMADAWKGAIGGVITNQGVDDLVANGQQLAGVMGQGLQDTGPDPWGPR